MRNLYKVLATIELKCYSASKEPVRKGTTCKCHQLLLKYISLHLYDLWLNKVYHTYLEVRSEINNPDSNSLRSIAN